MSRRGNRGAVRTGFEPATSCVTGRHSSQAELPDQYSTDDLPRAMTLIEVIKIRELVLLCKQHQQLSAVDFKTERLCLYSSTF